MGKPDYKKAKQEFEEELRQLGKQIGKVMYEYGLTCTELMKRLEVPFDHQVSVSNQCLTGEGDGEEGN